MKDKIKFLKQIEHYPREIEWLFNPNKGNFDYDVVEVETETIMESISIMGPKDHREVVVPAKHLGYTLWNREIKFDMYFFGCLIYEESKEDLKADFVNQLGGRKFYHLVDAQTGKGLGLFIK